MAGSKRKTDQWSWTVSTEPPYRLVGWKIVPRNILNTTFLPHLLDDRASKISSERTKVHTG